MIPAIGYMIASYVITRMLSMLIKGTDGKENAITLIFAGITILTALYCVYALFSLGTEATRLLKYLP